MLKPLSVTHWTQTSNTRQEHMRSRVPLVTEPSLLFITSNAMDLRKVQEGNAKHFFLDIVA